MENFASQTCVVLPLFKVLQGLKQTVKVNRIWTVEVEFIRMSDGILLWRQRFIK